MADTEAYPMSAVMHGCLCRVLTGSVDICMIVRVCEMEVFSNVDVNTTRDDHGSVENTKDS